MATIKILIVEDNLLVAEDLKNKLNRMDYHVVAIAKNGSEALDAAKKYLPDLVLMDIQLGKGMDGIETAALLRKDYQLIVIYLTAYADEKTIERAKSTEPHGYLVKPFDEKELKSTIEISLQKKQTELKLSESHRWLETTLKSIGDGVIATDDEGKVVFMNSVAEKLTGWNELDAVGSKVSDVFCIINEETGNMQDDPVACVLKEGLVVGLANHTLLKSKDGRKIPIADSGAPIKDENDEIIGVVLVFRDQIEERKAKKALEESEEKYRSIMESFVDPLYICSPDLKIEYINPAMIQRIGRDATGEKCYSVIHGVNSKCEWCIFDQLEKGKIVEINVKSPLDDRNYRVTNMPIRNENNTFSKMTIFRDITEYLEAISETEKAKAQLVQAQKMESVGRLAGGVAHDYNNALSVIVGFTELVKEKMEPTDPLHDDLDEVLTAATRATDLTRQLLAFAREQIIAPKVLDFNENVESILKMLRHLIGEDIDLAWLPEIGIWPVKVDPSQIDQILANLCVNARDAIEDVGKVTIETGNVTFDEAYCVDHTGFVPGEFVLLAVSDNGCGMDKETLDNIFEPFFTTKGVDEGTGLGLATVYGIVKQNNGFINVYSEPDQGTTIKIYLPRYEGKVVESQEESAAEIPPGRGETVLLVEDDLSILKLARKILDGLDYTVLTAGTPGEAMSLAEEHTSEIHMLVTDVIMPEMNGRELAERLQSTYPDLKCMFMSGYTANVIAHHGVLDDGVHFIQKPFSQRDLATTIRKALDE